MKTIPSSASLQKQMLSGEDQQPSRAGCTCGQLRWHIAAQFKTGMSWENYGDWVLDHITPQAFFSPEDEPWMNHFSNLQPLWNRENVRKSDRMGNTSARVLISMRSFTPETVSPVPLVDLLPEPAAPYLLIDQFLCGGFGSYQPGFVDQFMCGRFLEEKAA